MKEGPTRQRPDSIQRMEYGDSGEPIQPAEDGNGEVYCAHQQPRCGSQ